jgi:hypothetical protein
MSSIIENEIPSIKNASLPYSLQALSERNCNEYSKNAKFKDQEKIYTIYNLLGGEGKPGYGSSSSAMDYLNDIEKRYTTTNSDDNFIDTNKKIMNSAYHRFKNKAVEIELRNKIGYLIKNYNLNKLIQKISSKNLLDEFYNQKWKNINFYRKEMYYNKWKSSDMAAKEINKIFINAK